jgi:hypothetical protein
MEDVICSITNNITATQPESTPSLSCLVVHSFFSQFTKELLLLLFIATTLSSHTYVATSELGGGGTFPEGPVYESEIGHVSCQPKPQRSQWNNYTVSWWNPLQCIILRAKFRSKWTRCRILDIKEVIWSTSRSIDVKWTLVNQGRSSSCTKRLRRYLRD